MVVGIYDSIKNTNVNDPNNFANSDDAPYILKTRSVNRRFVSRFLSETVLQIQFGSGDPLQVDEQITPNADNVGIGFGANVNKNFDVTTKNITNRNTISIKGVISIEKLLLSFCINFIY